MGEPDPDALAERIPSTLFTEWSAFERVYGPVLVHERVDFMLAVLCARIGGGDAEDFLPQWDEEARKQSPTSMIAQLESAIAVSKGRR
jgi:hypothetical protein